MISSCASFLSPVANFVFQCYSSVGVRIGCFVIDNLPVDDDKDDGSDLEVLETDGAVVGDKWTNSTSGEHEVSTEQ